MTDLRRYRLAGILPEPISHYTDAVQVGSLLFVSGMLPVDADGEIVGGGDVVRQAEQVLSNVRAALAAAGATLEDVVRVGVFVRHMEDRAAINTVRERLFGASRPASTLVEVSSLAHPDALLEIEAVARVPGTAIGGES